MLWSPEESHSTVSPSAFPHPLTHLRKGFFNFSHPPLHCLLPRVTFGFNWGHTQGRVCSVSTAENQSMISRFFLFLFFQVEPCKLFASMWHLVLQHVGSSSLPGNWTWAPCIGNLESSHLISREVLVVDFIIILFPPGCLPWDMMFSC